METNTSPTACRDCGVELLDDTERRERIVDAYLEEVFNVDKEELEFIDFALETLRDEDPNMFCEKCSARYYLYHCARCGNDLMDDYTEEAQAQYVHQVRDLANAKDWSYIQSYKEWLEEVFLPDEAYCSYCNNVAEKT